MASGGKRVPAKPAAVSGPGRFSTRTDSGTAQMAAPGGSYGSRQALEAQAAAAPVPTGQQESAVPAEPGVAGRAAEPNMGAFGPTKRPDQSPMAGMVTAPNDQIIDPKVLFRVLAEKFPSPWILGMLDD